MSTAAYIVTLKQPVTDLTTRASVAAEIQDELLSAGFEVLEVKSFETQQAALPLTGGMPINQGLPPSPV